MKMIRHPCKLYLLKCKLKIVLIIYVKYMLGRNYINVLDQTTSQPDNQTTGSKMMNLLSNEYWEVRVIIIIMITKPTRNSLICHFLCYCLLFVTLLCTQWNVSHESTALHFLK